MFLFPRHEKSLRKVLGFVVNQLIKYLDNLRTKVFHIPGKSEYISEIVLTMKVLQFVANTATCLDVVPLSPSLSIDATTN